jgi:hypothetical protein
MTAAKMGGRFWPIPLRCSLGDMEKGQIQHSFTVDQA